MQHHTLNTKAQSVLLARPTIPQQKTMTGIWFEWLANLAMTH